MLTLDSNTNSKSNSNSKSLIAIFTTLCLLVLANPQAIQAQSTEFKTLQTKIKSSISDASFLYYFSEAHRDYDFTDSEVQQLIDLATGFDREELAIHLKKYQIELKKHNDLFKDSTCIARDFNWKKVQYLDLNRQVKNIVLHNDLYHLINTEPILSTTSPQYDIYQATEPDSTFFVTKEESAKILKKILEEPPTHWLTETLIRHIPVHAQLKVKGTDFYFSRVLLDDDHSRNKIIVYTLSGFYGKKTFVPRIFYKSRSDGGWRLTPGYVKQNDGIYSKGLGIHYTQETKPAPEILAALIKIDKESSPIEVTVNRLYAIQDLIEEFFPMEEDIGDMGLDDDPFLYTYRDEIGDFDDGGLLKEFQLYRPSANNLPENAEEIFANFNFKKKGLEKFVPNFNNPPKLIFEADHTLLGPTKYYVFEGELDGEKVDWYMAVSHESKVWIDRIILVDADVSSYGTSTMIIDSGALTNKPLEYHFLLGDYKMSKEFPQDDVYRDITELIGKLQPVQDFKRAIEVKWMPLTSPKPQKHTPLPPPEN